MYRLQHMNVIATTDNDAKKDALVKQGYQLLADASATSTAATGTTTDAKATGTDTKTTAADTKATAADAKTDTSTTTAKK